MVTPGLYAVEFTLVTLAKVPVLADVEARSQQLMLVELHEDADGWRAFQTVCDIRVDGGAIAKAEIPEAFVRATGSKWTEVRIEDGRFVDDLGINHAGWRLTREDEDLPEELDDPRIYDWDGDGQPAATIRMRAPLFGRVDLTVVQKSRSILHGELTGEGTVEGRVETPYVRQRTLAASNFLFAGNLELEPRPERSHFRLWDVPEDTDCAALLAATWPERGG